jgi:hypothetical protein
MEGSRVLLIKQSITEGKSSEVGQGEGLQGTLISSIKIGQPILFNNGSRTTTVQSIEVEQGSIRITTETSVYELHKLFSGLTIDSQIGRVSFPENARQPVLEPGSAPGFKAQDGDKIVNLKINRDELKDFLIQVDEAVVHIIGERYVVLARVGNAHIPFYRSSSGTDGKIQGEWYPFFGHTGDWLIKGNIEADGSMHYLPEITEIQKKLNQYLVLPDTGYLNKDMDILSDENIFYSVGKDIPIDNFKDSNEFKYRGDNIEEAIRLYVKKITGYDPYLLKGYHPADEDAAKEEKVDEWLSEVLQGIHTAQNPN